MAYWANGGGTPVAGIGYFLSLYNDQHRTVLINLGANDMGLGVSEASYKADLTTVLDAIHAKWPAAYVYVACPWRRGYDAAATAMAGWIAATVATRSSFAFVGMDESVWLKGGDNGATNTVDGVHYSAAGEVACVTAWQAIPVY